MPERDGGDVCLEDFLPWVEAVTGARLETAERLPTVRPMWRLALRDAQGPQALFLRAERPGEFGHARFYPVSREAAVLAALAPGGLPVPRVIARREHPAALLMTAMPGSADFAALGAEPERKARVVADFMRLLAAQHALDVQALGLDAVLPAPADPRAHARAELDTWERIWREATRRGDALLAFAAGWLRARIPACPETVLVHGDTGPNQCHYAGDAICALLDWELAHLGDPMEDLGCLAARGGMEDFGEPRRLFAEYQRHAGRALDLERIAWYRVLALFKFATATGLACEGAGSGAEESPVALWDAQLRYLLAWCLARAEGEPVEPLRPLAGRSTLAVLHDAELPRLAKVRERFGEQALRLGFHPLD